MPAGRFDETVRRAKAYLAAGADCIYPFGFIDMDTVARLVKAIRAPINIVGAGRHAAGRRTREASASPASASPRARRWP